MVPIPMVKAYFAAGCFWHVEEAFRNVRGVLSTAVGYTGGSARDPTYRQVCSGKTGHAETVEVTFDPSVVTYEELLDLFWNIHDPTTLNRQGPDHGTQYRSAIFYVNEKQRDAALGSRRKMEALGAFGRRRIVTQMVRASTFYRAEEYHQRYFEKNEGATCGM